MCICLYSPQPSQRTFSQKSHSGVGSTIQSTEITGVTLRYIGVAENMGRSVGHRGGADIAAMTLRVKEALYSTLVAPGFVPHEPR